MTKRSSLARDVSEIVFDRFRMGSSVTHLEVIAFSALKEIRDLRSSTFTWFPAKE